MLWFNTARNYYHNTVIILSSGGSCNVTAGTEGFTELVEANIKRILNPYKFNKDFCW